MTSAGREAAPCERCDEPGLWNGHCAQHWLERDAEEKAAGRKATEPPTFCSKCNGLRWDYELHVCLTPLAKETT